MIRTDRPTAFARVLPCAQASILACALLLPAASEARVRHHHALAARSVLVELFTAQGCSTCQPADVALYDLIKRKDVLGLTFSVDIWDFLGWSDTFAQPEFTARQRTYVRRLKLREMSTPQMVVQGAAHSAGLDKEEIDGLIDDAKGPKTPLVTLSRGARRVAIGRGSAHEGGADVWLVRYDPKIREVKVKTGESRGKTVLEVNVVRELTRLGVWRGTGKSYPIPAYTPPSPPAAATAAASPPTTTGPTPAPEVLKTAVIVQSAHGGKVLALGRE